ncbi:hypothetical protein Cantr_06849 [Candida viswanathii]|uniref:Transporter n=1 Tax=Candida viswanathii TaxID=5486 RepID=A0A367XWS9_9ASCO|nr:hypothetical protein Cantr_06849 [Candida viswanathii]
MSVDDNSYLTTYEAALAVVATAMKKARLRIDVLMLNSILGGMFFCTGGMLHVLIQGEFSGALENNPGVVSLLTGLMYPIGLFYVVILGVDLFNSNILFFSTGLCRGAISIWDLLISWIVSYWFNLVGNIFVCYVICTYSGITEQSALVTASLELLEQKVSFSFVQTFIKGIAGNFFVCLAIFLQLMAKPLHVKFLMMTLPVFTFVTFGFTHSVADMFMIIVGLINGAPVSVATAAWKLFVPAAIGNIIGGSFFGVVITWYLHIYVVEQDRKALDLPQYELRDEQPELNQDSRVVRQKKARFDEDVVQQEESADSDETRQEDPQDFIPVPIYDDESIQLSVTKHDLDSRSTTIPHCQQSFPEEVRTLSDNLFPVYGMGEPLARERTIAGSYERPSRRGSSDSYAYSNDESEAEPEAEYIGSQLKRVFTQRSRALDLEAGNGNPNLTPRVLSPRSSFNRRKSSQSDRSSIRLNSESSKEEKDLGEQNNSKDNLDRILE